MRQEELNLLKALSQMLFIIDHRTKYVSCMQYIDFYNAMASVYVMLITYLGLM